MVAVIDYGMGNVGSIINMLKKVGVTDAVYTKEAKEIERADLIILPGVGSFDIGMKNLEKYDLIGVLNQCVLEQKKPILGICLGMQLLGNSSEEGKLPGLGYIDFSCVRIDNMNHTLRVPHMGWYYVNICKPESRLLAGLPEESRFYFVHSYYAVCKDEKDIMMTSSYGRELTVAVERDNVYGTQFHPEKSHAYGMRIIKNFVEECI